MLTSRRLVNSSATTKIVQYGQMFGLGEKAGLNIDSEQPGVIA